MAISNAGAAIAKRPLARICALGALIITAAAAARASSPDSSTGSPSGPRAKLAADGKACLRDGGRLLCAPAHLKPAGWLWVGGAVAAEAICWAEDREARDVARAHQSTAADRVAAVGEFYGRGAYAAIASAGLYCGGFVAGNDWLRETGREALTALAVSGLCSGILKVSIGRSRPYTGEGPFMNRGFSLDDARQSFPSGHAITAFTLSSVLAARIGHPAASVVLYSLAALTAAQRVYSDEHWLSDVAAGTMMGAAIGCAVAAGARGLGGWHAGPILTPTTCGLALAKAL